MAVSEDCTTGPVFDGYAGSAYLRSRVQSADPSTTWVCFRIDAGPSARTGGKVVVTGASASGSPSSDQNAAACSATPGNTIPGPHPTSHGTLGDPSDPDTYVEYAFDMYAAPGTFWLCQTVTAGGETRSLRTIVPTPSVTAPTASFLPDATGTPAGTRVPNTAPSSGICQTAATGTKTEYVNSSTAAGHVWLSSWVESTGRVHLCARSTDGLFGGGGRLTLDDGLGAVTPILVTGVDPNVCGLNVTSQETVVSVAVRRSSGTNPASLCVIVNGSATVLTAGVAGTATTPAVVWTPDPGTPG